LKTEPNKHNIFLSEYVQDKNTSTFYKF
jgi:hypothetical protein